ncbi:hypothetical protein [Tenacibaculum finnmarkense]|uniref:Uncharacterized protein n=1 Tax=Tenacibaculum finnmarkense genomovar finnmarkense TaxID=1458503 RepID=A0AAP1RH58_9FLAO|nr:hypothetical protein [Tenacibaculum finnmarkense]MDB0616154.1 hypothetical protein [Tenacibaculum dicentrarchi]MBE7653944.1 hypothetical protein [Tenacibaculum finnmarkense genomovar finnmarkense]MBE7661477.1 hypothetical protein [Tenacibaculum finnmarkense genomovar finnmarkense]MBE7696239.1 hypothetical protein [Tenacibaculum finnmarkense genomovar finnmarkense]MCD8403866.1 hypothetical protein [Tenacibaculum finnmarkense genomovar finnmarkense]
MKYLKRFALLFLLLALGISVWIGSKEYYDDETRLQINARNRGWEENKAVLEKKIDQLKAEKRSYDNKITSCITQKTESISDETKAFLYTIKNYHSEVEIPKTVTNYYNTNSKTPTFSVFNYERKNDELWFGFYIGYRITMVTDYDNLVIHFSYSAGTAHTAFGTIHYNTLTKEVSTTEYSYGTGAGGTTLYLNGVKVKETFKDFTNE